MKVLLQFTWGMDGHDFDPFFKTMNIPVPLQIGMELWLLGKEGDFLCGRGIRVDRLEWDENRPSWITAHTETVTLQDTHESVVKYMTQAGWVESDYPDEYRE